MSGENRKTILLVEDEIPIAMMETKTLEKYGYKVITANRGEEAVEIVNETPGIDLILMDINLGTGINGPQAAEIIHKNRDLPVIFLSSHTEQEVVETTEGITSYGYIVKDSGESVLIASIKMAFRLFEAQKKEKEKEEELRESEERYRNILENMEELYFEVDLKGNFIFHNDAVIRNSGYTSEEMMGMNFRKLMDNDNEKRVFEAFHHVFLTGKNIKRFEWEILDKK